MGNQQLYNLNQNQLQILLSGYFGDGCFHKNPQQYKYRTTYSTIHEEYSVYRRHLLGDLFSNHKERKINYGYSSKNNIYIDTTRSLDILTDIYNLSIEDKLNSMTELGIALWFYDDGSLHHKSLFYNLNTQSFSKEVQEEYFIPFFNKHNIFPKIQIERKKSGKIYYYLRIPKYEGSCEIAKILSRNYLKCFDYKVWSSETIQKWSKLQERLKSLGIDYLKVNPKSLSSLQDENCKSKDIIYARYSPTYRETYREPTESVGS